MMSVIQTPEICSTSTGFVPGRADFMKFCQSGPKNDRAVQHPEYVVSTK